MAPRLRHRRPKGAETVEREPTATAPHLDSTIGYARAIARRVSPTAGIDVAASARSQRSRHKVRTIRENPLESATPLGLNLSCFVPLVVSKPSRLSHRRRHKIPAEDAGEGLRYLAVLSFPAVAWCAAPAFSGQVFPGFVEYRHVRSDAPTTSVVPSVFGRFPARNRPETHQSGL